MAKNSRNQKLMTTRKGARKGQSGGGQRPSQPSPEERVWQVVALIPAGRVASYGQVAALAGMPNHARFVGRTLRNLPQDTRLPWHRVVNASLRLSLTGAAGRRQRQRLESEAIEFVGSRIATTHHWQPR